MLSDSYKKQDTELDLRSRSILNLSIDCLVLWEKSKGQTIAIECATVSDRDKLFANITPFCDGAQAMGYTHCIVTVRRTKIRHQCKLSTLISFDEELGR